MERGRVRPGTNPTKKENGAGHWPAPYRAPWDFLERVMRFELTTLTLAT